MSRFDELFEAVRESWPDEVDLADAGVPSDDASGHYFPALSSAWDEAEARYAAQPDSLEFLLCWSMFGTLHERAMQASRDGATRLVLADVPLSSFEARFRADIENSEPTLRASLLAELERD